MSDPSIESHDDDPQPTDAPTDLSEPTAENTYSDEPPLDIYESYLSDIVEEEPPDPSVWENASATQQEPAPPTDPGYLPDDSIADDPYYEPWPDDVFELAAESYAQDENDEEHADLITNSSDIHADNLITAVEEDQEDPVPLQLDLEWGDDVSSTDHGPVALSPEGLEQALENCQVSLRFNSRSRDVECLIRDAETSQDSEGGPWQPLNDLCEGFIKRRILETVVYEKQRGDNCVSVPWEVSVTKWTEWCNSIVYKRQKDPFVDWLADLPEWDREVRHPLHACFDLSEDDDNELIRWAAWQPLYGTVRRALDPGHKIDQMVVLFGTQGCGKSTYWSYMMPTDMRSEWSADGFVFTDDYQRRIEKVLGAVIVEADEMTGSKRADVNAMKSFLTQTHGRVRLAYRKNPESIPFRHMLVGTSNQKESLPNDPTGLRRFIPITVAGDPYTNVDRIRQWWDDNRLQVWAEAWHKCIVDIHATDMPAYLYARQALVAEAHRTTTEEEEAIANWIIHFEEQTIMENDLKPGEEILINIREMLADSGMIKSEDMRVDGLLESRAKQALTRNKYQPLPKPKRVGGKPPRRYWCKIIPPLDEPQPPTTDTPTIDDISPEDFKDNHEEPF